MKKLILAAAVFGWSVSGVQAAVLDLTGSHDAVNEIDYFYFTNNSVNDVTIVMDTLNDGLDADLSLWVQNGADWNLVRWIPDGDRPALETGSNIFGVPFRNGYIPGDAFNLGTSDPGSVLSGLAAGQYLVTVGEGFNYPLAEVGQSISIGFLGAEEAASSVYAVNYPHAYTISISGDVSQVPVPAAVWLFGSGLLGLVSLRRKA